MDKELFEKYTKQLHNQLIQKKEIITILEEETGVIFTEEEFTLQKNKIIFHTSSVKKTILYNKDIKKIFIKKGYIVV